MLYIPLARGCSAFCWVIKSPGLFFNSRHGHSFQALIACGDEASLEAICACLSERGGWAVPGPNRDLWVDSVGIPEVDVLWVMSKDRLVFRLLLYIYILSLLQCVLGRSLWRNQNLFLTSDWWAMLCNYTNSRRSRVCLNWFEAARVPLAGLACPSSRSSAKGFERDSDAGRVISTSSGGVGGLGVSSQPVSECNLRLDFGYSSNTV